MKQIILALACAVAFASCKKDTEHILPVTPVPAPVDDAREVLLKSVVSQGLPNPYFLFTYDSLKYVRTISFASDFAVYNVAYKNKRVNEVINIRNDNKLTYTYSNGNVSAIDEFSGASGQKVMRYEMLYNEKRQLTQVIWFDSFTNDSLQPKKKVLLAYHEDGNLSSIDKYYNTTGELKWSSKHIFSNYDNKKNVDDFYMLEDFFDTFLFLPQVKLQQNNPQLELVTGDVNDYRITYTYQYNNDLPKNKSGMMTQTKGASQGKTFAFTNLFNYH